MTHYWIRILTYVLSKRLTYANFSETETLAYVLHTGDSSLHAVAWVLNESYTSQVLWLILLQPCISFSVFRFLIKYELLLLFNPYDSRQAYDSREPRMFLFEIIQHINTYKRLFWNNTKIHTNVYRNIYIYQYTQTFMVIHIFIVRKLHIL